MKKYKLLLLCTLGFTQIYAQQPLYRQATAPIESRVSDLLQRMTLDEKIGQLCCPMGWEMYEKKGQQVTISDTFKALIRKKPIGAFWATLRADPWTKKTLETGLNPTLSAKALNALQKYMRDSTRLGIPLLFAEECAHGHMAIGTTVFPTSLAQASTWDEPLIHQMGEAIGLETRLQGAHISYGPVLDLARELRWSRVEETFGEDPVLTGTLGTAFVKGLQGQNIADQKHTYATLKHFVAYGIPESGQNGARANIGLRQLLAEYLPPFKQAITEGKAGTIMSAYNTIDGVPCTSNSYLLTELLRKEWGFDGFVFSDLFSIERIADLGIAPNHAGAAVQSIQAGLDMDLGGNAYGNHLKAALQDGRIKMTDIDKAVRHILRLKFRMGLFENPFVLPEEVKHQIRNKKHRDIAYQVASEGTVLLKNEGVLPLSQQLSRIAVIGPNADTPYNQLGDYTAPQERSQIVTILDGIRSAFPKQTQITYVKGCAVRDTLHSDIPAAVKAAKEADVTILVVGGSSARDFKTQYIETGAAVTNTESLSDMECGEGYDRLSLDLLGDQEKLMQALFATGKPVIVVYMQGRPLNMNTAARHAGALLTCWYPGEQGGKAVADLLTGKQNPSGKLPVSIPQNVGQLPVYYTQEPKHAYVEGDAQPLYPFGYGLSYTSFEYGSLELQPGKNDTLQIVRCQITNTGKYDGAEVVQLYIHDKVASVYQPPFVLKAFKRVFLRKNESQILTFYLRKKDLSVIDAQYREVVEPGTFSVKIGSSSQDIRLERTFTIE